MLTSMRTARVLVIVGFLIGLISLQQTVGHIGDDAYRLVSGNLLVDDTALAEFGGETDDYIASLPAEDREVRQILSNGQEVTGAVAEENPEHVWYHLFREANGDIAAIIVVLMLMYLPAEARSHRAWWMMMILLVGYYSPFWTGALVDRGMAAPHIMAEIVHVVMAAFPFGGVLLARRHFGTASNA